MQLDDTSALFRLELLSWVTVTRLFSLLDYITIYLYLINFSVKMLVLMMIEHYHLVTTDDVQHRYMVSVVALLLLLWNSTQVIICCCHLLLFSLHPLFPTHLCSFTSRNGCMGAGLGDLSISDVLISTYLWVFFFIEAMTSALKLFQVTHVFTVCLGVHKPEWRFLMHCYNPVLVVSELTVLWLKRRFVGWRLVEASCCSAVALSISATWLI